jgi:hypothetical protein
VDFCGSIEHGANAAVVAALCIIGCRRADGGACAVAVTLSWRGAASSRRGQPKDGSTYIGGVGAALVRSVEGAAAAGGYAADVAVGPTQCGQLNFAVFTVRALRPADGKRGRGTPPR